MADDFQGIIALSDAQCREGESQAKIAQMMAETAVKWQEVQHKHLENVALFLKIKWDSQAHENLRKAVVDAQYKVKKLVEEKARMERKLSFASKLLQGSRLNIETLPQAWLGFYYVMDHVPVMVVVKAHKSIKVPQGAFLTSSWDHPFYKDGSVVHDYTGRHNANELFQWAARSNYFPVPTEPAWEYLTELFEAIANGTSEEADKLDARIKDAEAKALELSKIDWSRLNQQGVKQ